MAETAKNSRVSYSPVRMSPLDKERTATDLRFLILLFLILSAWIVLCVIAISYGSLSPSHDAEHDSLSSKESSSQIKLLLDSMSTYTTAALQRWGILIVLLGFLASGVAVLGYFLLVRVLPKLWARIAIGCMLITVVLVLVCDVYLFTLNWSIFGFKQIWDLIKLNIYGVICVLTLQSVSHVGVEIIAQYVGKTCRAVFYYPSAFLFGLFLISLDLLITMVTVVALSANFDSFDAVIALCGFYLHNFIYYFGIMVYSQIIGSYHAMENQDTAPKRQLLHAIRTVFKYHTGTAAFAATAILPFLLGIYVLCKHTAHYAKTISSSSIEIAWKILLLFGIADFALIMTSFHGVSLFDATKRVFTITSKKSSLALAVTQVLGFIIALGVMVSMFIAMLVPYFAYDTQKEIDTALIMETLILSACSVILLMLPVFLVVVASGMSTLLYYIEDDEDNESRERPCQVPLNGVVTY